MFTDRPTNAIVIAVLESFEVFRRQCLWLQSFMPKYPHWEVILVDDGSEPELELPDGLSYRVRLLRTHDTRPWTQPCARNYGARASRIGPDGWFLMTDIDHVLTEDCIRACEAHDGDKVHFSRSYGALGPNGELVTDTDELVAKYGAARDKLKSLAYHYNTFGIRRWIFDLMKGYDPKFCGRYGGDDTDFSKRYAALHYEEKRVKRAKMDAAHLYVYPDPKMDRAGLFHNIRYPERKGKP